MNKHNLHCLNDSSYKPIQFLGLYGLSKIANRKKLVKSQLRRKDQHDYEQELLAGLTAYTYLEK